MKLKNPWRPKLLSLPDFKAKVLGQHIDLDNFPAGQPYQCVDLVSDFALESCGADRFHGNAVDIARQVQGGKFSWVDNNFADPTQMPPAGAIVVYGKAWGGGYGHTGIVLASTGVTVTLLEQNSPEPYAAIHTHPYDGMIGWLIPAVNVNPSTFGGVRRVVCIVDKLNVRSAPRLTAPAGQGQGVGPDGNMVEGNQADVLPDPVAGDWYQMGGRSSNQWRKTSRGNYIAALGVQNA